MAELLDKIENLKWQEREKLPLVRDRPSAQTVLKKTIADARYGLRGLGSPIPCLRMEPHAPPHPHHRRKC